MPVDGRLRVDGRVVANRDLEVPPECGTRDVIAVGRIGGQVPPGGDGPTALAGRTVHLALRRQLELTLRLVAPRLRVAVLTPRPEGFLRSGDLRLARQLYRMGQEAGRRLLHSQPAGGRVRSGWIEVEPGAARREPDSRELQPQPDSGAA